MASHVLIQTARADFLDTALYGEGVPLAIPRLGRGALLTALSQAFDLAEGRRPGHAQRVAYVAVALAEELGLDAARVESAFFAGLLHDVGMAACPAAPRIDTGRGTKVVGGTASARDVLGSVPSGGWSEVIEALGVHCDHGGAVCQQLGFGEEVVRAVMSHHDCWESPGSDAGEMVARVVAAADRVESMIEGETSPLAVRRRGPALVREMSGNELDPVVAGRMAHLASRDEFWLGLYDTGLAGVLTARGFGGVLEPDGLVAMVEVLGDVVDLRNGRQHGRGRRVADLASRLARECGLDEEHARLVRVAALLQDIGTLGVPIHVLSKPDILTVDEMSAVQMHPAFAREILGEVEGLAAAAWWVGCHHERVDGKGYPAMLEGDDVPLEAQIIGIAETFEALTSDRPHRKALTAHGAREVLRGLAGARFRTDLVDRFEALDGVAEATDEAVPRT